MIKAIMAVDDKGGISKGSSMPWPKNSKDLQWFKRNTLNQVVVMGSKTWEDPFMPTPLQNRENILVTTKGNSYYPEANKYIKGNIVDEIEQADEVYPLKNMIKNETFDQKNKPLIKEFTFIVFLLFALNKLYPWKPIEILF